MAQDQPLVPSLTQNTSYAALTTLSIDLLEPQRPVLYDPTGSSVLTSAFNPVVESFNLNSPSTDIDTGVRDSSQTGEFNTLSKGGSRLALLLSGGSSSSNSATGGNSGAMGSGMLQTATSAFSGRSAGGAGEGDRSQWGNSSSFGAGSSGSESSLGSSGALPGSGRGGTSSSLGGGYSGEPQAEGSDSSGRESGSRSGMRSAHSVASASSASGGSSIGRLGSLSSPSNARLSGMNSSGSSSSGSRSSGSLSSSNRMRNLESGASTGDEEYARGGAPRTIERVLQFSPKSYEPYILGGSPFASPGSGGELSFLNPNIFDVTPIQLSPSRHQNERRNELRLLGKQEIDSSGGLESSSTHYGLQTHLDRDRLSGARRGKMSKRSGLDDSGLDADSLSGQNRQH